ncbi:MAG: hypothetical protein A2X34_04025 [Elusimicrobia bacterium GWC2_51_8]|nr:MAG: hypothetical protein A2X33_02125 [Elusimicrobia bacterium GWA2_51_34]OGR60493.1 MAG: hypothetical protein A2X34_04025 [Elusimicrobia bacterium GWC2_51_8]
MKNLLKFFLTAFALTAVCGPVLAQDETAAPPDEGFKMSAPAKPAPKKAAAKKKKAKKKKKAPEPASEYKFKSVGTPPSYKFDKKADPIIKGKPKTKAASKKIKKRKKSAAGNIKKKAGQPSQNPQTASDLSQEPPADNPAYFQENNSTDTVEEDQ